MIDERIANALTSAVYMSKTGLSADMTDDQKIRASGLYDNWAPGDHKAGEVYNAGGQTWECHSDYDNAVYPDIVPGSSAWPTFNRPLHGKTRETARPWVQPQYGTTDIYKQGEWMIWTDGLAYQCTAPNGTNFSPEEYPGGWKAEEVTV